MILSAPHKRRPRRTCGARRRRPFAYPAPTTRAPYLFHQVRYVGERGQQLFALRLKPCRLLAESGVLDGRAARRSLSARSRSFSAISASSSSRHRPRNRHERHQAVRSREGDHLLRVPAPVHVALSPEELPAHVLEVLDAEALEAYGRLAATSGPRAGIRRQRAALLVRPDRRDHRPAIIADARRGSCLAE